MKSPFFTKQFYFHFFVLLSVVTLAILPVEYIIDAPLRDFKNWYPRFYLFLFIASKLIIPVLHGIILFPILKRFLGRSFYILFLLFFIFAIELYVIGLNRVEVVKVYLVPIFCFAFIHIHTPIMTLMRNKNYLFFVSLRRIIIGSIVFVLCITLSLVIKKGHPFTENSMFNEFSDHTVVFYVKDNTLSILPLSKYTNMHGDEFFQIYKALLRKYDSGLEKTIQNDNSHHLYTDMLSFYLSRLYRPLPADTIFLYRRDFYLCHSSIIDREQKLSAYHVESK